MPFSLAEDVFGEDVGDMAHRFMGVDLLAIGRGDSRAFLSAMLQRIQTQIGHLRGVG